MTHPDHKQHKQESGATLLIMVAAITFITAIAAYYWTKKQSSDIKNAQTQLLSARLADAKEQLLIFSESIPTIYANTSSKQSPGFFLCPDMDPLNSPNVGSSNGSCSWATGNAIGRLPTHKSTANGAYFYFSTLEQQGGDSWWYMIHDQLRLGASGNNAFYYLNKNPVYDALNNTLTYNSTPIVAAIIYGQSALSHQTNRNASQNTAQQWNQFLETVTTTASGANINDPSIVNGQASNDMILTISKTEYDSRIKNSVCQFASQNHWCDANTYNALSPTHWFKQFNWAFSSTASRICIINVTQPNGMNTHECP